MEHVYVNIFVVGQQQGNSNSEEEYANVSNQEGAEGLEHGIYGK